MGMTLVAGLLGGVLGLGGGLILAPLLLSLGVQPQVNRTRFGDAGESFFFFGFAPLLLNLGVHPQETNNRFRDAGKTH